MGTNIEYDNGDLVKNFFLDVSKTAGILGRETPIVIRSHNEWGIRRIIDTETSHEPVLWVLREQFSGDKIFDSGGPYKTIYVEDLCGWPCWFTPDDLIFMLENDCRAAVLQFQDIERGERAHLLLLNKSDGNNKERLLKYLSVCRSYRQQFVYEHITKLCGESGTLGFEELIPVFNSNFLQMRVLRHEMLVAFKGSVDWYEGHQSQGGKWRFAGPLTVTPFKDIHYYFPSPLIKSPLLASTTASIEEVGKAISLAKKADLMHETAGFILCDNPKPVEVEALAPVSIEPSLHLLTIGDYQDTKPPHGPIAIDYTAANAGSEDKIFIAEEVMSRTQHLRGFNLINGYAVRFYGCDYPVLLMRLELGFCRPDNSEYQQLLSTLNLHDCRVVKRLGYSPKEILTRP